MTADPQSLPTWDLTALYRGLDDPRLEGDIEGIVPAGRAFRERWRGRVAEAPAPELGRAVREYEGVCEAPLRPYAFAHLLFAADSGQAAHVALLQRVKEAATGARKESLFFPLELDRIDDGRFADLLGGEPLAPYRHYLAHERAWRPHRLSEPEEAILTLKDLSGRSAFVQLYSQLTQSFRFRFELDREERERTGAEMLALLKHPDRGVRRRAYEVYAEAYERQQVVLGAVWNALVLDHRQSLELRRHADPMEPVHLRNEVSPRAVEALLEVTRAHYGLARRYYRWKARVLGVERLWSTDLVAPLPGPEPEPVSFDRARGWVLEAFEGFHPEFAAAARGFFDERRIDAPPRPGKAGGAFCMGVSPRLPVYVLVNHTGKLRDAATLAHELGHGVHFTLARGQPLLEYSPALPLAETASVFGELLLADRLERDPMDPAVRRNLLAERVEDVIATTFRQTLYTDFEYRAHREGARGYLSPEQLCRLWGEQLEAAYGDSVEQIPAARWAWSAIPHFVHTRFYCYAYVFGELLVLALYRRYREEGARFAPKMLELLQAGGSRSPGELVGRMGYDLEDPEFWAGGYRTLEHMIDELEGL
ncbi:MAG: M3 family oligoendopeptidase [Deferrisomatales bacterium]